MEARAIARYVRISPTKVRTVTGPVSGKTVNDALNMLKFVPKRAARIVGKVIYSALANASQNSKIDVDTLFIKRIFVDDGPRQKRWRARSMGRANRIIKRTSHITVILDES
ncbi:MAG: 50S ribosomal protein L22 [Pseudomonadota bacterium]